MLDSLFVCPIKQLVLFSFLSDSESPQRQSKKSKSASTPSGKDLEQLKRAEKALVEENNLLKIKNDLLLDMISEVYSEMKLEAGQVAKR